MKACLRILLAAIGIAFAGISSARTPFDEHQFESALATGRPVVVHVRADWCRTYARPKPIVEALLSYPMMIEYRHFTVDADRQKALLRRFAAPKTSTIIVYKGRQEVARSVGQTDPNAIAALLEKAL